MAPSPSSDQESNAAAADGEPAGAAYHALSFSEILDGAFNLYRRKFAAAILAALIPYTPLVALVVFTHTFLAPGAPEAVLATGAVLTACVGLFAYLAGWGGCTRIFAGVLDGDEPGVGQALAAAARRMPRMLGAAVIVGIVASFMLLGSMLVLLFIMMAGFAMALPLAAVETVGVVVVFIFAAVAWLIQAALMILAGGFLFATLQTVVLEPLGAAASVRRTYLLLKAAKRRVAGVFLATGLLAVLPFVGLGLAEIFMVNLLDGPEWGDLAWLALVLLAMTLVVPYVAAAFVLLRRDRIARIEAPDLTLPQRVQPRSSML